MYCPHKVKKDKNESSEFERALKGPKKTLNLTPLEKL
jgi:hypothetical protein